MRALRQRIAEREAAVETASDEVATPRRKRRARSSKLPVSAHKAFVPMVAAWGFVVGAGVVMALPPAMIARVKMASGLAGMGMTATIIIAALAGLICGLIAFGLATLFKRQRSPAPADGVVSRLPLGEVEPIDPLAELGSDSLDAPIEREPFSPTEIDDLDGGRITASVEDADASPPSLLKSKPAKQGDEIDAVLSAADYDAAWIDAEDRSESEPLNEPRELDLGEFAELPGRNAVWVEEPASELARAPARTPEPETLESYESGIAKLRDMPTSDLSLVQMVERFAAALHERQDAERRNPSMKTAPGRDAALAEALKALTIFTEGDLDSELEQMGENSTALRNSTRELRDALAKLQDLRGAA